MPASFPTTRLRRLRRSTAIRDMVRETQLQLSDFIYPLFISQTLDDKKAINSMPGQYQYGLKGLQQEIPKLLELGIQAVILFGIPAEKDAHGSDSYDKQGIVQQAIMMIKDIAPELMVITDTCFCEYTDHGHCGVINDRSGQLDVDNDATLALLGKQAVVQAEAGADMIAPSGSIDGMVTSIRQALDAAGFEYIPIMSYAVKYCSSLYGPFRDAAESPPQFGNRTTYQMDPANGNEALREAALDLTEGADMLMVKPAINYLDVIYRIKQQHPEVPLAAYQVSGEYAMLKAAAKQGAFDERTAVLEALTSIKRAGADVIISYFAKDIAGWLKV